MLEQHTAAEEEAAFAMTKCNQSSFGFQGRGPRVIVDLLQRNPELTDWNHKVAAGGGGWNLKHKVAVTAAHMLEKSWSQWCSYVGFPRRRQSGEDRASRWAERSGSFDLRQA